MTSALTTERTDGTTACRVYWGSHGCDLTRGHEGTHYCSCCTCADHAANHTLVDEEDGGEYECVGQAPYYGPDTRFSGADASA